MNDDCAREWDEKAGHWHKWAGPLAAMADRFNQPMIAAAAIGAGARVLDLASGAGEPALSIARTVGPEGRVIASDIAPRMLEGLRRRAGKEGCANMDFRRLDMRKLPFADESFDAVTCRFGIMFPPETDRVLTESHRVLRPGGHAVWLVWGEIGNNTLFQWIDALARRMIGISLLERPASPFRFADTAPLLQAAEQAGFSQVNTEELRFAPSVAVDRPFWITHIEMNYGDALAKLDDDRRRAFADAVGQMLKEKAENGRIRLQTHARLICCRR